MKEEKRAFTEHEGRLFCITKNKKNSKNPVQLTNQQKNWLKKRAVIESVIDLHKKHLNIEHSRHRAPLNGFTHIFAALAAYTFYPDKPSTYVQEQTNLLPAHDLMAA